MRVDAIKYLQTQGAWDGKVWRANWFSPRIRLNAWKAAFWARDCEEKIRTIKKAMSLVSL